LDTSRSFAVRNAQRRLFGQRQHLGEPRGRTPPRSRRGSRWEGSPRNGESGVGCEGVQLGVDLVELPEAGDVGDRKNRNFVAKPGRHIQGYLRTSNPYGRKTLTMPTPLSPSPTNTLAAASPLTAGHFGWALIAGAVGLVAIIRVVRRPAGEWTHGMWSKVGWILVILYVIVSLAGYPLPIGAGAAIWRTRRPKVAPTAQLPFDTGGTLESK
jgi:hypothetical protein